MHGAQGSLTRSHQSVSLPLDKCACLCAQVEKVGKEGGEDKHGWQCSLQLGQQTTDTAREGRSDEGSVRVRQTRQPLEPFSGGTFLPYFSFPTFAYHQQD